MAIVVLDGTVIGARKVTPRRSLVKRPATKTKLFQPSGNHGNIIIRRSKERLERSMNDIRDRPNAPSVGQIDPDMGALVSVGCTLFAVECGPAMGCRDVKQNAVDRRSLPPSQVQRSTTTCFGVVRELQQVIIKNRRSDRRHQVDAEAFLPAVPLKVPKVQIASVSKVVLIIHLTDPVKPNEPVLGRQHRDRPY